MKEILLRLGNGSLTNGFPSVNVELRGGQKNWQAVTSLWPAPELKTIYQEWLFLYKASLHRTKQPGVQRGVTFAATPTNFSVQDIYQITNNLTIALNSWLNQGDFYTNIQAKLRTHLSADEHISIVIITDDLLLWELPWHRWDFFKSYDRCVECFSKSEFQSNPPRHLQPNGKVDILAIWGHAPELDLTKDLAALRQTHARVQSHQPTSALGISDLLAQPQIDMLFFGGHGETIELELDNEIQTLGMIYLDKNTSLSIDKIKTDLKQAVDRGLQIAIFNCCSGLGLAAELADLNIPYLTVMRSQIPDQLAQNFCRDLLKCYSDNNAFITAFQYARERLKPSTERSDEFESWLPMLLHNPNSDRITWRQLCQSKWQLPLPKSFTKASHWLTQSPQLVLTWIGISVLSTGITIGLKSLAPAQTLESLVIDRFQATQANSMTTTNQLVIIDLSYRDTGAQEGRIVPNGEFISGESQLQELSQIPFAALGLDIKIEHEASNSFLEKPNISRNCAESSPSMVYTAQINPDCLALAWQVTKNHPQAKNPLKPQQPIILNPYLAAKIQQVNLSDLDKLIDSNPTFSKDKIILVGTVKDQSSSVMLHATATAQILSSIIDRQPLTIPVGDAMGTIYILLWSGLTGASVFALRRSLPIMAGMTLLSAGTGWLLFTSGYLLPLLPTVVVIGISSSLISLIRQSHD
jgi:CHASE2 domain-containing sensor protein